MFVSIENGSVSLSTRGDETPDRMDEHVKDPETIRPIIDLKTSLPGYYYRWIQDAGNSPDWFLRISILIPFLATGLLAAFCFYRYRALRRSR